MADAKWTFEKGAEVALKEEDDEEDEKEGR